MANGQLGNVREYLGSISASPDAERIPDGQLLDRYLRQRDEGAFAALVQRYGRLVLGVCQRLLHDGHEAEDAFQATFLVLVRKAGALGKRQPLSSWLYEVAYRTALKARGNAVRRRAHERQAAAMGPAHTDSETHWLELRGVLDEELSRLPNKYRAPLVLCYLQGKSNQEAARELGWPSGSMSRRITRGRQILRDRLVRRGILFSPALLFTLLPKKALAAVVPGPLVTATLQAAALFGNSTLITAGGTSTKVIALAEEVAKGLCKPRLRTGVTVLIVLATFGGAGAAAVAMAPASSFDEVWSKLGLGSGCHHDLNPASEEKWVMRWQVRSTFTASQGPVLGVAFTRDGSRLAAGTANHEVKLWNLTARADAGSDRIHAALGDPMNRVTTNRAAPPIPVIFTGHHGTVNSVAFSPDGRTLASASQDRTIKLWAVDTRQLKATLQGHGDAVLAVAFSPDGKTLASAGADQTVRLWDVFRGQELKRLVGHEGQVEAVAFAPKGATVASGGQDGTVRLWGTSTGLQKAICQEQSESIGTLAFSPDGHTLVTGSRDGSVKLWDLDQAKTRTTFPGHSGPVRSVAFAPDGTALFSAGQDRTMKHWLVYFNKQGAAFDENSAEVNAVACAGNPVRLASGNSDGQVQLWELAWKLVAKK
jgi:RNA polymerase sigma factor (sigma-70 family)